MSVNKVILVGNVGKDPEVKHLDGDLSVGRFPLATSERFKDRNGNRTERTEWHNIVVWRGLAKVAEDYVKKGMQLYVEGRIQSRKYQDKDGNDRYVSEIVCDNLQMLGKKGEGSSSSSTSNQAAEPKQTEGTYTDVPDNDDLPF